MCSPKYTVFWYPTVRITTRPPSNNSHGYPKTSWTWLTLALLKSSRPFPSLYESLVLTFMETYRWTSFGWLYSSSTLTANVINFQGLRDWRSCMDRSATLHYEVSELGCCQCIVKFLRTQGTVSIVSELKLVQYTYDNSRPTYYERFVQTCIEYNVRSLLMGSDYAIETRFSGRHHGWQWRDDLWTAGCINQAPSRQVEPSYSSCNG